MTGSAKQSMERQRKDGLLRRFAPKKKQTDKLLILFNVMDEPPPSVLFHPRGSAKGRCGTRNDGGRRLLPERTADKIAANRPLKKIIGATHGYQHLVQASGRQGRRRLSRQRRARQRAGRGRDPGVVGTFRADQGVVRPLRGGRVRRAGA